MHDALLSSTANAVSEVAGVSGREPGGEFGSGRETGSEPGSETNGNGEAVTMEPFAFLFGSCFFLLLKSMKGSSSDSELEKKYMGSKAQVILILQRFFFCC